MRKRTSVQNFVPSHTAGKRSPKRAARLPFSTCCASHWPQIVPLLVDGKLRKSSWGALTSVPNGSLHTSGRQRPKEEAQLPLETSPEKHRARQLRGEPFILPMIIRGSEVRQQRLVCDWPDGDWRSGRLLSSEYRNVVIPGQLRSM
jgi:hypothetical protein